MPEQRPVYGCVGSDRPEAQLYIVEEDGILYYTCPACREEIAAMEEELDRRRRDEPAPPTSG